VSGVRRPRAAAWDWTALALKVVLFASVILQRIGVPVGTTGYVSPVLVTVLVTVALLVGHGRLVEEPGRVAAYLAVTGACLLTALVHGLRSEELSVPSLGLLVVTYVPFCFRVRDVRPGLLDELLRFFVRIVTVVAVLAVGQTAPQLVGVWQYRDLLAQVVPAHLLVQGYNTSYPVTYGSEIYKANGVLMLEPSFCSQFLGLGILALLLVRVRRRGLLVALFAVAMVATVSGTGVLLLATGLVALAVRRGPRFAVALAGVGAVVATAILLSPLATIYSSRAREVTQGSSSGNQRFVAPYQLAVDSARSSAETLLVGRGPGYADREALRLAALTAAPLTAPPLAKLVLEYGVPAGLAFALFIAYALWARAPSKPLAATLLVYFFVLSSSLLQTQTIYLGWVLGGALAAAAPAHPRRPRPPAAPLPRPAGGQRARPVALRRRRSPPAPVRGRVRGPVPLGSGARRSPPPRRPRSPGS